MMCSLPVYYARRKQARAFIEQGLKTYSHPNVTAVEVSKLASRAEAQCFQKFKYLDEYYARIFFYTFRGSYNKKTCILHQTCVHDIINEILDGLILKKDINNNEISSHKKQKIIISTSHLRDKIIKEETVLYKEYVSNADLYFNQIAKLISDELLTSLPNHLQEIPSLKNLSAFYLTTNYEKVVSAFFKKKTPKAIEHPLQLPDNILPQELNELIKKTQIHMTGRKIF